MADKIEMIIEYTTDGTDYQYCDNHGVLVRCKDCKYWEPHPSSSAAPQYHECKVRLFTHLHTTAMEFCSYGERKDGEQHDDN